jgi:hypothetical protein
VQRVREPRKTNRRRIVRPQIHTWSVLRSRALNRYLIGLQLNTVLSRLLNDRVSEIFICIRTRKAQPRRILRCKIAQVLLQLGIRDFAGNDLPAQRGSQRNRYHTHDYCDLSHRSQDTRNGIGKPICRSFLMPGFCHPLPVLPASKPWVAARLTSIIPCSKIRLTTRLLPPRIRA